MALLHLETFDHLVNANEKYTTEHGSLVSISSTYSRRHTRSLKSYSNYHCKFPIAASDTGVIGFAVYNSGTLPSAVILIEFLRSGSVTLELKVHGAGVILFERGTTALVIAPLPFRIHTWHYVEVKWNCVNSIGANTFQLKVDGELILNIPASTDCQNAGTSGVDAIYINGMCSYSYFNDVYICDLTGSEWNDFQGDITIDVLHPNGNGNTNDFIGSDSDSVDNYLLVDDATPDDDTTYTESSTVTDVDLYAFDNSEAPDTVLAVAVDCFCLMDDAGPKSGKLITYVNSSTYEGDTFSLTTGYIYETQLWVLNPDDSAAWAAADIDGAEFGVKVEA